MDGGVQPGQRVGIQQLMPLVFTQRKPGTSELTTAQTSFLPVRLPEQTCLEPTLDQVQVRTLATRRISLAMPRLLVDWRFIPASIVLQIRSSEPTRVDTATLGGSIPFLAFAQELRRVCIAPRMPIFATTAWLPLLGMFKLPHQGHGAFPFRATPQHRHPVLATRQQRLGQMAISTLMEITVKALLESIVRQCSKACTQWVRHICLRRLAGRGRYTALLGRIRTLAGKLRI